MNNFNYFIIYLFGFSLLGCASKIPFNNSKFDLFGICPDGALKLEIIKDELFLAQSAFCLNQQDFEFFVSNTDYKKDNPKYREDEFSKKSEGCIHVKISKKEIENNVQVYYAQIADTSYLKLVIENKANYHLVTPIIKNNFDGLDNSQSDRFLSFPYFSREQLVSTNKLQRMDQITSGQIDSIRFFMKRDELIIKDKVKNRRLPFKSMYFTYEQQNIVALWLLELGINPIGKPDEYRNIYNHLK